jgi:hypothetical protein
MPYFFGLVRPLQGQKSDETAALKIFTIQRRCGTDKNTVIVAELRGGSLRLEFDLKRFEDQFKSKNHLNDPRELNGFPSHQSWTRF